jgi:GNAT superfamily N-acetyltransferase
MLADASVRIEPLGPGHDKKSFVCGHASLDRYIREQAAQDIRRGVASIFVAVAIDQPVRILGYFTLSAASVAPTDLPLETAKKLPRVPIPAALIGRLAVDRDFQGRRLGSMLLADAVQKAIAAAQTVAMTVVVVDPIDDTARSFYAAFGFRGLEGPQRRMFLTLPRHNAPLKP